MRSIVIAAIAAGLSFTSSLAHAQTAQVPVADAPPGAAQPVPEEVPMVDRLRPELFGYVKAGYFLVLPQSSDALVGSNSGFRLINARLGLSLRPHETIEAVVSFDGALPSRDESDPLEGNRVVALRDAFVEWGPSRFARIRAGQFKAPFNAETLLPDEALPFITRSIVSEGLLPPEGFRVSGLALERQVGVQLSSERLGGDLNVQYAAAVVNGNGANVLNNDNNAVAPVGRVQLGFQDLVAVGVNAFQNSASIGTRPNRIRQNQLGYGADVSVNLAGLSLFGMFLQRNTSFEDDTGLPSEQATGAVASARYLYAPLGVEAGARFAWYEPSNAVTEDSRTELTAMVGYRPATIPARILLQYTLRAEEAGASLGNDSVDLMAQVTF